MTEFAGIRTELPGDGVVTFDRPDKLNAMTRRGLEDVGRALWDLDRDSACGTVVISQPVPREHIDGAADGRSPKNPEQFASRIGGLIRLYARVCAGR